MKKVFTGSSILIVYLTGFLMLTQMFSFIDVRAQIPSAAPPDIVDSVNIVEYSDITTGADRINEWVQMLEGKSVGAVVNRTSILDDKTHLVDALLERGVDLKKIFAPEHGFRTDAGAGEKIENSTDTKTGLPIISLYGSHRKPTSEDLEGIDIVIFDIQDVGVRFYTYISTLEYVMQACNDYGIEFILLDRPNPNGFYVAGPLLDKNYQSFVGRQEIPIVYGLTIGEYAEMLVGEEWIKSESLDYTIVKCRNYNHQMTFDLPVKPSPNLPTHRSVLLYPSLCLLEGTKVSVGRGTEHPFEIYGHPDFRFKSYVFTPRSMPGAKNPKLEGENCFGMPFMQFSIREIIKDHKFSPKILCRAYEMWNSEESFFLENNFIDKLVGTDQLRKDVLNQKSADEIQNSWENDLRNYMDKRNRYLLYP